MNVCFRVLALAAMWGFLSPLAARGDEGAPLKKEAAKEGARPEGPARELRSERDRPPREFDERGPRDGRRPDERRDGEGPRPGGPPPPFGGPGFPGPRGPMGPPPGLGGPHGPPHGDLERFKEHDPEMYALLKSDHELERKAFDLAQRFRTAPTDQKGDIRKEMKELVGKHFEVRQQRRKLELSRLEAELKRLNDSMKAREEARTRIIDDRLKQLLGEEGDLGF